MKNIITVRSFIIFLIFILAFVLRFHSLSSLPPGLGRDEVSVAYNAYSILKTGHDEHGRFLPLYFEAIGDQKLPVIIFLSVPSIAFFGLTELGARLPFAVIGFLTVATLYLLTKEIRKLYRSVLTVKIILFAPFLLAVNPWHLAHSRAVYEITLGTFFFTLGTLAFFKGLNSGRFLILSLLIFAVNFYTYSMTRLLSPLLFIFYLYLFRRQLEKLGKRIWIFILILSVILLLPFMSNFLDPGGIYGPKGAVIFTSSHTLSKIQEFRSYIVNTQASFIGPILFNRIIMTSYEYFRNVLKALSFDFYFANGSDMAGIGTNGQFYLIEIVPFIIGLILAVKKGLNGDKIFQIILGWIILSFLIASLTVGAPYATRTLFTVVPVIVLISSGWLYLINYFMKNKIMKKVIFTIFILSYIWHITFYLFSYYIRFPVVYASNWESKTRELFRYLKEEEKNVDYVVITKPEYSMYAFLLFYNQILPETVWGNLERHLPDSEGWQHGKKLGKYEFRDIDWNKDNTSSTSAILVSRGDEYPDKTVVTKEIYYPTQQIVYPYGQKVISIPVNKVAFKIWKIEERTN